MERLDTPKFDDFWWDVANPEERERVVLKQAISTALFAKDKVPFYRKHYEKLSIQIIQSVSSLEDFAITIPYISKEHLANIPSNAFLPETEVEEIDPNIGEYWVFPTGGTTGKPIQVSHSMQDWRGMVLTADRHIAFDFFKDRISKELLHIENSPSVLSGKGYRSTPLKDARILGAYNRGHITNNIYASMLIKFGSKFHWRPYLTPTPEDVYDAAQKLKINGLLASPEEGTGRKAIDLGNILRLDAQNSSPYAWNLNHRYNSEFRFIFWSSVPLSQELLSYLKDSLRVPYIKGHFGSTEVAPTGATCSVHMRDFHLVYGHSLVLIKSMNKEGLAEPDEFGYTMVSKVGAVDDKGDNVIPSGTYLINYITGDGARMGKSCDCECGRNTPLLYDIRRVEFHAGKAVHGCQVN
jgi:phenylacetate-coenzyme A ligase PaaK-like adenylate-forming protein